MIWRLLSYDGEYDDEPLDEMYEALLNSGTPFQKIRNFLEQQLLARDIPEYYGALVGLFWYRIYTTNIDDLVQRIYLIANSRLDILAYPKDEAAERDQSLAELQLIHLNGRLPCSPNELTFSPRQYARAGVRPQPLYDQFVRDFATHPVIFLGTRLNEPLFWQALEARQERGTDISEYRPKSFLVAPKISPAKRDQLARLNVVPVEADTRDFLLWLENLRRELPSRLEVLQRSAPDFAAVLELAGTEKAKERDLRDFGAAFGIVPTETRSTAYRSVYLLGAAPRWEDLFQNLDAPRQMTPDVRNFVETELVRETPQLRVAAILGSAGSGKSTILRRVGLQLAQAGRSVYVTNSESLPSPDIIRRVLDALADRAVLLFDNAEIALGVLPDIISEIESCERPPIVLIASRTNDFDRLWGRFHRATDIVEFHVPHLNRAEIEAIIRILDEQHLLGELRGMKDTERLKVFEEKAKKQILVAMREATTSRGFDLIIKDEFEKLVPDESRLLYLCAALATDAGYRLTREEFVACSTAPPAEALHLLNRNLRDIVVSSGTNDNLLLLRHRLLAEVAIGQIAPRPLLREAYIRLLSALAPEIRGSHWRTRSSGLAHALWNHKTIYGRFRNDIDEARGIFSSLSQWFGNESHFWLQFGNLELEGRRGDLRLAENYLRQAESLDPKDPYIQNALGHLLIRKGVEAHTLDEGRTLRAEGTEVLKSRIDASGLSDAYPIHILCAQRYEWARVWLYDDDAAAREEFEWMRELLDRARRKHPRHQRLRKLGETIERAYLELAIPAASRPEPPVLPDDEA